MFEQAFQKTVQSQLSNLIYQIARSELTSHDKQSWDGIKAF